MYKKIWIIVISVILILMFSGSIIAKEVLSGRIELKDGSIIIGRIEEPSTISVEIRQKKLKVAVKDIVFIIGDEIKLKDGSILKGTVEIGQITVQPVWSRIGIEIKGEYIVYIHLFQKSPVNSDGKPSKKTESFTWDWREKVIFTATGNRVEGYVEFAEELRKVLHVSLWGSVSILDFTENKNDLEAMRNRHTIFLIRPENLEELEKLEAKHPDLLPLSYSKLKSYSFPLLYFSRDDNGKIRGVIITDEVTPLLAKLLTESALPLDIPLDERLEKK